MTLMSRIGRGLVAKSAVKPAAPKPEAAPKPPTLEPGPRVSRDEMRRRLSEGQLRRNAPVEVVAVPVPTSARRPPSPARWPNPPEVQLIDPSLPLVPVRELSDAEARARGILPDGELLVDLEEAAEKQRAAGVEVFGEPLPPPRPTPAPPDPAVLAAARAAPEKEAAAAELEAKRAEIDAGAKWKSQCKAIDPRNGLRCGLLHGHTVNHRNARGEFTTVAQGRLVSRGLETAAWSTTN